MSILSDFLAVRGKKYKRKIHFVKIIYGSNVEISGGI